MKVVTDWLKKVTDFIMPIVEEPVEEEVIEKKEEVKSEQTQAQTQKQQTQAQNLVETVNQRRAAMGGGVAASVNGIGSFNYKGTVSRPNLKLIKPPEFVMKVYQPDNYNQTKGIVDDILAHKAAVVNYESVTSEEQLRMGDYIDGVCYAVDGTVTKISEKIVLYVPFGINTSDIAALVASVRPR